MAKGLCYLVLTALFLFQVKGDDLDFFVGRNMSLRTEKWNNWYIVMGSDQKGVLHGRVQNVGEEGLFVFERLSMNEPFFYIKSTLWKTWYVYMTEAGGRVESTKTRPNTEGQWRVTKINNGKYVLSPRNRPNWYMCMKNDFIGTMIGCESNVYYPEKEGTILITERSTTQYCGLIQSPISQPSNY